VGRGVVRAAFVLGFLLVGLLVPTDVAQAQSGRGTKNWEVKVEYLNTLNGVAFCRDNGGFYMVKGGLSAMDQAATNAHESKHLEQHGRFKNCAAFHKYYDTPKGRLAIEAEAFAAGWCAQVAMGGDPLSIKQSYLLLLIRYYVPGTQVYEAAQIFAKYERCG
jgi:hypothetical protein